VLKGLTYREECGRKTMEKEEAFKAGIGNRLPNLSRKENTNTMWRLHSKIITLNVMRIK
jgi:hypothetical protein